VLPNACPKQPSRAAEKKVRRRAVEKEWQSVRSQVLRRDRWKCRHCKSAERIEVHHLKPRSLGREDSTRNCLTLCAICHAERHAYRLFIRGDDANKGVRFEVLK
jgi:5-methylcytosine-specific restriction endonuclease McrA